MFADPYVVTINSVAKNLVRINQDKYSSEYLLREALGEYRISFRNSTRFDKRLGVNLDRHNVELIHTIYPVAPAVTGFTRKTYLVIENQQGDTLTDPVLEAIGLLTKLIASSGADLTKMINFES